MPSFRLLKRVEVSFDIACFRVSNYVHLCLVLVELTILSSFQWINPYTVVAMDTHERIHLISAKTDEEVEVTVMFYVEDKGYTIFSPSLSIH